MFFQNFWSHIIDKPTYLEINFAETEKQQKNITDGIDGKIFKTSEYAVGVTAEPFHPNCRCYTIPYYDDMHELEARAAKDPVTGEVYEVSGGTSYKQWKKQQDEKYGSGIVDKMRKLGYNENADREQFEAYKSVIGDVVPDNFEEFQKLKHDDPEAWERLRYQYRTVNRYEVNGKISTDKIVELDNAAWYTKQTGFDYSTLTGYDRKKVKNLSRSGNAAVMELDGSIYFSHSHAEDGNDIYSKYYTGKYPLIGLQNHQQFKVLDLGDGIPRKADTEAKFLEFVATQKKAEDEFKVTILSEKHICKSCAGVVEQFKEKYPNATVNVISGKTNYNGSEAGNNTWKYRKRVHKDAETH